MKHFLHFALLSATLSTAAILPSLPAAVLAESAPILISRNVNFKPPDVEAPDNRQGATHRGEACPKELSIIALIPKSNRGLTVEESPTLFAYVSQNSVNVEFNLQTEDGTEVYATTFKVDKPGIVGVRVPAGSNNKKTLEVGKRYQWSFSVVCNPQDRSGDYYVKGFVQRVEPSATLKKDLANPEPMARAIAYANSGIWYETVSTLAAMRRKSPDDPALTAEWQQLLESQKLDAIATQPLLGPL
ncbi:MAG: DUF928 domain-containing protein [Oscillatoriaceae cyanobacterium Prado104]|nr:DUF928 domain-containing protein [Oscillatoriaceae cyanobacterium Prado104]